MLSRLRPFNTLRNQILFGFILVMAAVLFIFGINMYHSVSGLLKASAAKHIQQTAVQAGGRLDAVIGQMDTLTAQIMTDSYVQELLLDHLNSRPPGFTERQSLARTVSRYQTYSKGINRIELYTADYRRLFPLDELSLDGRVEVQWIRKAEEQKGRLLWLGLDPREPDSVLALRRISLVDRWFSSGGYLLISMDRSTFHLREAMDADGQGLETMILTDPEGIPITSDLPGPGLPPGLLQSSGPTVLLQDGEYMAVRHKSVETGWTLLILTPLREVTKGISVLRTAILVSGAIGFVLFLFLSYWLSGLITRPILRLIKTMRGARDGVLKPHLSDSRTLELRELNNTYNQMVDNINELIRLVYEKELVRSRTELKALQAQINPHFLYNTLEAFYWSLSEKGEEELADLVIAMSHIFRYVISSPERREWVTLQEELEHIERYLQIMKMRLGLRLVWSIECPEACAAVPVPKLLIQPLVENAIVHGIEGRVEGGTIRVRILPMGDGDRLSVTVGDDGAGMEERELRELQNALDKEETASRPRDAASPSRGTGVGIRNVKRRLELTYGETAAGLAITSQPGQGTTVRFEIPLTGGETEYGNGTDRIDRR
ncbi:histidine kinase [Gorillibacterium sp. sgz5001074]|uniref:sensor histidine kinase n=1 Tax=Gorillibacterium sp. sgz5001074 TaxID=3446695 RepID=UPI003F66FA50